MPDSVATGDLADRYRQMTDETALGLAAEPGDLTAQARTVLAAELRGRGHTDEADLVDAWAPPPAQPGLRLSALAFAGAHAAATLVALVVWFGAGMTSGGGAVSLVAGVALFVLGQPLWWAMAWALDADLLNGEDLFGVGLLVFVAGAAANSLLWGWAWRRLGARRGRAV